MSSGDADTILLNEVERYRMMTVEAARCLIRDGKRNAMVKRLGRHVQAHRLKKAPYLWPRCYWHVGVPLGSQALPRHAAVLCYCVLGEPQRELSCWRKAAAVVTCGEQRELVFVDLKASSDHVARKIKRYCGDNDLTGIQAITVLVPTPEKGNKVWRAARKHSLPLPVRCAAIDDLKELLGL